MWLMPQFIEKPTNQALFSCLLLGKRGLRYPERKFTYYFSVVNKLLAEYDSDEIIFEASS